MKHKNKSGKREKESLPAQRIARIDSDAFIFLGKWLYSFLRVSSSVCGKDRPKEHGQCSREGNNVEGVKLGKLFSDHWISGLKELQDLGACGIKSTCLEATVANVSTQEYPLREAKRSGD